MPIVDEKKEKTENVSAQETGCCGGVSKEAAKVEEKKGASCSTETLEHQSDKKQKEQGSSCCG